MPSRKRKRPNPRPNAPPDDEHAPFMQWVTSHGVTINSIAPATLPGRGTGLITLRPVHAGDILIRVPPQSMLRPPPPSASTNGIGSGRPSPQAQLTHQLLHLAATGDEVYTRCAATWPSRDDFAACLAWFDAETMALSDLFPAALGKAYNRLLADAEHDWKLIRPKSKASTAQEDGDFLYHWAVANTRSFSWKMGAEKGSMVICPFLDFMNHCQAGDGCEVKMSDEGYTLTANRKYAIGEEILATYGAHSNDKLLAHYGFIMQDSKDDSVSLDDIILGNGNVTAEQRSALETAGYLGNYNLIPSTNEICFRTQVAIRTLILTSNEWEFFMTTGDDITSDQTEEVKAHLTKMIEPHLKTVAEKMKKLEQAKKQGRGREGVLGIIIERWKQIQEALEQYIGLHA